MKKNIILALSVAVVLSMVVSCEVNTKKEQPTQVTETVKVDTVAAKKEEVKKEPTPAKKEEKKVTPKEEQPVKEETPVVAEVPDVIGGSPDAVFMLDDNDTESTPKFADGEKAMKKLLKKALRKAKKGEKARFRASIVIKADGSVGRVQFTECGYNDDYKPEIIEALRALPAFTPGTKDGKPVDSWYYLNYKR